MFNMLFGKKKYKNINEYSDKWLIAKGAEQNKPIFIRYRVGLAEAIGHPQYPFQIGVATPLLSPTAEGLTVNLEAEVLGKIEEKLEASLTENNQAVLAFIITTNGMREFVFYASEWKPEIFEQKVKAIDAEGHDLQFMMKHDKDWNTFKQFVPRQ